MFDLPNHNGLSPGAIVQERAAKGGRFGQGAATTARAALVATTDLAEGAEVCIRYGGDTAGQVLASETRTQEQARLPMAWWRSGCGRIQRIRHRTPPARRADPHSPRSRLRSCRSCSSTTASWMSPSRPLSRPRLRLTTTTSSSTRSLTSSRIQVRRESRGTPSRACAASHVHCLARWRMLRAFRAQSQALTWIAPRPLCRADLPGVVAASRRRGALAGAPRVPAPEESLGRRCLPP